MFFCYGKSRKRESQRKQQQQQQHPTERCTANPSIPWPHRSRHQRSRSEPNSSHLPAGDLDAYASLSRKNKFRSLPRSSGGDRGSDGKRASLGPKQTSTTGSRSPATENLSSPTTIPSPTFLRITLPLHYDPIAPWSSIEPPPHYNTSNTRPETTPPTSPKSPSSPSSAAQKFNTHLQRLHQAEYLMRKAAPGVRKTDGDRPKTPAAAAPNAATKDGAPRPIRIQIPAPAVARNQVQSPCSPTLVSKPPAASTTTRTVNGISKSPAPASTPSSPPSSQPPTPPPKDSPIHKAARTTADPATIHVNPTTESNTLQPLPSPPSPTATKLPPSAITIRPPKRMSSYMSLHLAAALSATNTTPHKFTPSLKSPISPPPALILTHESDDTESDDSEEDSDTSTTSSDPDTSNLKFVSSPQQQRQQHQAVPTSPVSPTAPKRFSSFNAGALVEQLRRQKEMGQAQAQAVAAY